MGKLAVLFADVCGSAELHEKFGDYQARKVIMQCITTTCSKIPLHNGKLVKTIGDEIMVTFPDAEQAFNAACAMQDAVAANTLPDGSSIQIRIGFNYGEVINESFDVFGTVVNIASRVAAITRAGQIMTTHAVFDELPEHLRGKLRQILRAELKDKKERLEIYQVVSRPDDLHSTRSGMSSNRKSTDHIHELVLRNLDKLLKVNDECRTVMLGRGDTCDMRVRNDLASRLHCLIELRLGKFILVDQSANGTYVQFGEGDEQHISQEEIVLHGEGVISLSVPCEDLPDEVIEFSVTTTQPS